MKHLKYFEQASAYEAYKNGSDYITPNVSYVVENNGVWYEPFVEPKETRLICTYDVIDTTYATRLCDSVSNFSSMEIDGIMIDNVTAKYTFDSVGEHTVKFELADPTTIGNYAFNDCWGLTSVVIPNSVTTIGESTFFNCARLTSINIPNSVTTIGESTFSNCSGLTSIVIPDSVTTIVNSVFNDCNRLTEVTIGTGITTIYSAFWNCSNLTSITCLAPTAPSIQSNTFYKVSTGGTLYVPSGSDYSSWMSTSNYYLGKYNWTIEYI